MVGSNQTESGERVGSLAPDLPRPSVAGSSGNKGKSCSSKSTPPAENGSCSSTSTPSVEDDDGLDSSEIIPSIEADKNSPSTPLAGKGKERELTFDERRDKNIADNNELLRKMGLKDVGMNMFAAKRRGPKRKKMSSDLESNGEPNGEETEDVAAKGSSASNTPTNKHTHLPTASSLGDNLAGSQDASSSSVTPALTQANEGAAVDSREPSAATTNGVSDSNVHATQAANEHAKESSNSIQQSTVDANNSSSSNQHSSTNTEPHRLDEDANEHSPTHVNSNSSSNELSNSCRDTCSNDTSSTNPADTLAGCSGYPSSPSTVDPNITSGTTSSGCDNPSSTVTNVTGPVNATSSTANPTLDAPPSSVNVSPGSHTTSVAGAVNVNAAVVFGQEVSTTTPREGASVDSDVQMHIETSNNVSSQSSTTSSFLRGLIPAPDAPDFVQKAIAYFADLSVNDEWCRVVHTWARVEAALGYPGTEVCLLVPLCELLTHDGFRRDSPLLIVQKRSPVSSTLGETTPRPLF